MIKDKGYATLSEIAADICEKKGLELETSSFLNSDKKIYVYDNEVKAREYMSYISEKAGGICCAGRTGKIQIKKLGEDEETIPQRLFKTYKWGEEHQISRVAYENGTETFKVGDETKDTLWIRQENLFISEQDDIQKIYDAMKELIFYSFEGTTIINPAIDIGDIINIDGKKVIYQGEMTLNKRFIADIKSKIAIKQKQETTTRKQNQKLINRKIQSQIDEENLKLTQLVQETTENSQKITEHTQTLDSISNKVQSNTTDINNNYQEVLGKLNDCAQKSDIKTISKSVETIQTDSKYAIEVAEEIKQNGATKVKTSTGYTFDEDGLTIEKTNAKTRSKLNEAGLEIKDATGSSEESLLFAGYDEKTGETIVKSKNMTVEKYLVVGKHTRFEDYKDSNGTQWTGAFWLE